MPVVIGGCEAVDRRTTFACYVVLARTCVFLRCLPVLGRLFFGGGRVFRYRSSECLCGEIAGPFDALCRKVFC